MPLFPYIMCAIAVSSYAMLGPIAKKIGTVVPPFTFITISSGILVILAGTLAYFFEHRKVAFSFHTIHWNWLFLFTLINLFAYACYLLAISKVPIAQYQMFLFLAPVVGGTFAVFLLNEPFHARYLLSLAVIAAGLGIAIYPELQKK